MRYWFPVALGGALGSLARYALSGWISERTSQWLGPSALFPWGTLIVNLMGCGLLGFLSALWTERFVVDPWWRCLLGIGLLGGFTTFSTFGFETWVLWSSGSRLLACANALGSLGLGILGVAVGSLVARVLVG